MGESFSRRSDWNQLLKVFMPLKVTQMFGVAQGCILCCIVTSKANRQVCRAFHVISVKFQVSFVKKILIAIPYFHLDVCNPGNVTLK